MIAKRTEDGFRQMAEGIVMQNLVHGANTNMVRFRLAAGSSLPLHSHPHEQTGVLLEGAMRFSIAGDVSSVGPGDSWCIPGGVEHSLQVLEDSVVIEIFSPLREEYLG
ncbi:MAG: cupin domain-containing protein [Deinococcales bacterium]